MGNDECSNGWKYLSKTWTNIGSVQSNELFEPKWEFEMNAFNYFIVYDIQIHCDGTANPTASTVSPTTSPSRSPSKQPTKYPTNNPTVLPKQSTLNPTNHPTFNTTMIPTLESTLKPTSEATNILILDATQKPEGTLSETTNVENIENALDEETTSNDPFTFEFIIIATSVSGVICLICIVVGLCLYSRKRSSKKNKLIQFEMTGCESPRSVHSGTSDIASISLQSMNVDTNIKNIDTFDKNEENEDVETGVNESESNEAMYDQFSTPRYRGNDVDKMPLVNEGMQQQIEVEQGYDDDAEQLYIDENKPIITATNGDYVDHFNQNRNGMRFDSIDYIENDTNVLNQGNDANEMNEILNDDDIMDDFDVMTPIGDIIVGHSQQDDNFLEEILNDGANDNIKKNLVLDENKNNYNTLTPQ